MIDDKLAWQPDDNTKMLCSTRQQLQFPRIPMIYSWAEKQV